MEGFVEASQEEREASIHPVERVDVHTERGSRPPPVLFIAIYLTVILRLLWNVHTTQNTPVLVRSPKISWVGPDQYYVEESRGNPG